ncbi:bifunctional diaminohydroxyphosphoribosylaminopyrimidine deaminase/5-amino-6-(5-phosphoribosylamino)uracil reductase RibD [Pasteurella oralis]|uniref:Riboflavin biosynthesis protein RibD n=1 Tax=Pasteurella oralis TaxID=1071947 RepID=A0ABW4NUF1_9PAST
MSEFSVQDVAFMQMALDLAQQGQFTTTPNPSVGCVLVKAGRIVGKGFHFRAGEPHAEVMALREAGENARGATAYVTLEPCSHFGRTPPCAKGLIEAGVVKVISAMHDPNPQVAGKGLQMLAENGIESAVGLLAEKAEWLNRGFLKRMRTGKPFVQLKMAMSLDGRTALANGESKWITNALSRADVQVERAKASAILSASQTVIADDPLLNVRWEQLPEPVQQAYSVENLRQPVRVILDSQHQVTSTKRLFKIDAPVWLVSKTARDLADYPVFCKQILLADTSHYLQDLMFELGQRQINTVWIEAGATLAGALIEQNLVDELIIYTAPKLLGDEARGLCKLPHLTQLADATLWKLHSIERLGDDIKSIYHPIVMEPKC